MASLTHSSAVPLGVYCKSTENVNIIWPGVDGVMLQFVLICIPDLINEYSHFANLETHSWPSTYRSRVPIGAQSQQWNMIPVTERDTVAFCCQIHVCEKVDILKCSLVCLLGNLFINDHERWTLTFYLMLLASYWEHLHVDLTTITVFEVWS